MAGISRAVVDELKNEIERLNKVVAEQQEQIEGYKENIRVLEQNRRNAGRKTVITEEVKAKVARHRIEGWTYEMIAEELELSLGLVHKVYKMMVEEAKRERENLQKRINENESNETE